MTEEEKKPALIGEGYDWFRKQPDGLKWLMGIVGAVISALLIQVLVSTIWPVERTPEPFDGHILASEDEDSGNSPTRFHTITPPRRRLGRAEALRHFWEGRAPEYAIRLVPDIYPENLDSKLGPDVLSIVFVGDFAEVKGLSLERACEMFGMWPSACSVTVFKVSPNGKQLQIRPGSARGLLKYAEDWGQLGSDLTGELIGFSVHGESGHALSNWAVDERSLESHLSAMGKLPAEFWKQVSGFWKQEVNLTKDWMELGYAVDGGKHGSSSLHELSDEARAFFENEGVSRSYGARCFLVNNVRRSELKIQATWWIEDPSDIIPAQPFIEESR